MELAPSPLDVEEFKFKLQCRLKVFQPNDKSKLTECPSLVCAACQFGLVFIGCHNDLQVLFSNVIASNKSKNDITSYQHRKINLPSPITHIAANCDSSLLCVVISRDGCPIAVVYQVVSFLSQHINIVQEIRLSATPNVHVVDIAWNPTIPNVLAVCVSDGSVVMIDINPTGIQLNCLPPQSQSKCLCWSPKGKQIVVGAINGTLSQYKPDLKIVKTYQPPPLNNSNSITIVNVLWVANYQFIGTYRNLQDPTLSLSIIVVNVPKGAPTSYVNFEDICYSSGTSRPPRFFLIHQQVWNLVLAASANSMEVGVLGILDGSGGTSWQQWIQSDESRAELPLSASKEETYPVGFAFDTSSTIQLPWGENQTLPPMPILYILSHEGVLSVFNVINLKQGVPMICSPPQTVPDQSGLQYFTSESVVPVPSVPPSNSNLVIPKPQFQQLQSPVSTAQVKPQVQQLPDVLTSKPQQFVQPTVPMSAPPSNITKTFSFANATSTPIIKELGGLQPKINPEAKSVFFKPNIPTAAPINSNINFKTEPPKPSNIIPKEIIPQDKPVEVIVPEKIEETRTDNVDNSFVISLIAEELKNFQSEINILLTRCRQINTDVGNDNDKTELVKRCEALVEFFNELVDTTATQKAEIHSLKQLLIEGFALQEEAQSRYKRLSNPQYVQLFKIHEIDPISQKKVSEIKRLLYYVESQLNQVNQSIDEEWNDFQDSCQRIAKNIYHTPTLEAIYQSMIKQNEIIMRQNFVLKDIKVRVKSRNRKQDKGPLLMNIKSDTETTIPQLVDSLKNLNVNSTDVLLAKYKYIEENQKKFTTPKEDKLRGLLLSNKLTRIAPNKPSKNKLSSSILPIKSLSPKKHVDLLKKPTMKIASMPVVETTPIAITKIIDDELSGAKSQNKVSKKLFEYYEDVTPPTTPLKGIVENKMVPNEQIKNAAELNVKASDSFLFSKKTSMFGTNFMTSNSQEIFQTPPSTFSFNAKTTATSLGSNVPSTTFQFAVPTGGSISKVSSPVSTTTIDTTKTKTKIEDVASFATLANQKPTDVTTNVTLPPVSNKNENISSPFSFVSSNQTKSIFGGSGFSPITTSVTKSPTPQSPITFSTSKPAIFESTTESTSTPFGSKTTTSTSSMFGNAAITTASVSTPSIFGSAKNTDVASPSVFGTVKNTTSVPSPTIFGSVSTTNVSSPSSAAPVSTPSIFGSGTNTTPTVLGSATNITSSSTPSVFGTLTPATGITTPSLFAATTVSSSVFGLATNTTSSTPFQFSQTGGKPTFGGGGGNAIISSTGSSDLTKTDDQKIATSFALGGNVSMAATTTVSTFSVTTSTTTSSLAFGNSNTVTTTPSISTAVVLPFGSNIVSKSSSFGNTTVVTTTPISFGSPNTASILTGQSLFGTSITTNTTAQSPFSTPITASITTAQSPFGTPITASTTTTQPPLSATSTTPQSPFGISSTTVAQSSFVTPGTTTTAVSPFGTPGATTITTQSLFGASNTTSTTSQSLFGASNTTSTTVAQSLFGTSNTSTTTAQSIFGASNTSTTTTQSLFGASNTTSTTAAQSLFGTSNAPSTTAQPPFGIPSTQTSSNFGFGSLAVSSTTATTTASNNSFNFGNLTVSALSPQASTTTTTATPTSTGASTFSFVNSAANTPPSNTGFSFSQNLFNQTPTTTNQNTFMGSQICSPSVFSQGTTGSVFGQSSQPQTTGSIFGDSTQTSTFGQKSAEQQSVFGATTNAQSPVQNTGSIFSKPTSTGSVFGQQTNLNSNIFGAKPTTPTFGQTPAFGQKPTFGSPTQSNIFGNTQANSNSNSPFANQNANRSVFGSQFNNTFRAPTQNQPITGAFSSGGQSISQSGFGSPTAFQKPASGFGSPPAFGSSTAFGSPPTFGGSPSFGTPPKVFGAPAAPQTAPPSTFGTTQQNSTFANLATQNTVGFGNLAQAQQPAIPQTQPSTFSGGNAFSSWR